MQHTATADWPPGEALSGSAQQRRNLVGACLAHFLHDGYTDQIYALLPVWQTNFGLSYAGLALVRALYSGTMGGLQIPVEKLAAKLSTRAALALATFTASAGYMIVALPLGFPGLCIGLIVAGTGSSLQHPRASTLVTHTYGKAVRGPLATYNFAGDMGKAFFPAAVALLLPVMAWRPVVVLTALAGVGASFALLALLPKQTAALIAKPPAATGPQDGRGFNLLFAIGAFDTAARMGYLLFLPFLVHGKGGQEATIGVGLALLFAGGALGKASCGWLGQRLGVVGTVIATEAATSLLILATLFLPLGPTLCLLPCLGIVLNGTSSVLYGSVPALARNGEVGRAFALFYTGVLGAGGLAPIAYGVIADHFSRTTGIIAASVTALTIIPLALALRPHLHEA
jgi:MFS family permease